jgi:small-conductance mechanosensitive channel
MLPTRIRSALLAAACALLAGAGRPAVIAACRGEAPLHGRSEEPTAPPPRPVDPLARAKAEIDERLRGRSAEELRVVLDQLAAEWTARRGASEVAYQRFTARVDELAKARALLTALKEPDAKTVPLVARAADVEPAIKVAQQLADYRTARAERLEAATAACRALIRSGEEFEDAASAAELQLAKMEAALKAVEGKGAVKTPEAFERARREAAAKRLKELGTTVREAQDKAKGELYDFASALAPARAASAQAAAKLDELKTGRESVLEGFAFEERVRGMGASQLTDEFNRLRKELTEKTAAIGGDANDYAKALPNVAEARAKRDAVREPAVPSEAPTGSGVPLEEGARKLVVAQQYLGARVRAADERAEKTAALVGTLDELEKKALAYSTTLDVARRTASQLAATAAEIERRVGRGDLEAAKAPEGVVEATDATGARAKLDEDANAVRAALAELRAEREALRKPDAEADNLKALTAAILGHVTERIDRLTDLKKRAADYATARKDRSESEQRRLDQRAAERMAKESAPWDQLLALDRSKLATDASDLLSAYYKELVDLDERDENLKHQKETLERLIELTRKEAADVAKLRVLLEKQPQRSEDANGALRAILERDQWDDWLAGRLAPTGLKAEAGLYHDEQARLAAVGGANARRVQALTGTAPPEPGKTGPDQTKQPATGGEIGKARTELFEARVRGLTITGIKIGLVLLAALIVPRVIMFVLRRALRGGTDAGGNQSPVLSVLRRVLKAGVWVAALALILSVLGYDVMALVVALAIGALVIGLAARPMISDVLGSVVIFAERRFQVGDVVRLGTGEPARVVGLTWRSTALKSTSGLLSSVPNRKVTETVVENLSRGGETYDTLAVTVSTDKDAGKVINVIRAALAQCKNLAPDSGVTVVRFNQKGHVKVVEYRFWWFLKDYEARNKTRDEVFARIAVGLATEDMTGIEVTLA